MDCGVLTSGSGRHRPVMLEEALGALLGDPDGRYVDATFGRGGHSRAILARLSARGRLLALDRDGAAAAAAADIADGRFRFDRRRFSELAAALTAAGWESVDGVLLDLGVSSPQIDDPARGFSWRGDGPLDMRMDRDSGPTAADWLARAAVDEIARVLRDYGEERHAARLARAIVAARREAPLSTTGQLAGLVARVVPRSPSDPGQHPAARTFQALRIQVNDELGELDRALPACGRALRPGGRLAVLSFHSLEDRRVKEFLLAGARPERAIDPRLALRQDQLPAPLWRRPERRRAGAAERDANPRARSATLRSAERTAAPWPGAGEGR